MEPRAGVDSDQQQEETFVGPEDLCKFPALRLSGYDLDPRANGDYAPTLYQDLADGYLGAFWAPRCGGRMVWQRVYDPVQLGVCSQGEVDAALVRARQESEAAVKAVVDRRTAEKGKLAGEVERRLQQEIKVHMLSLRLPTRRAPRPGTTLRRRLGGRS